MAALGLGCFAQVFSACGEWAPNFSGFSWCGARAAECVGCGDWLTGLAASQHVGSSQTRE